MCLECRKPRHDKTACLYPMSCTCQHRKKKTEDTVIKSYTMEIIDASA